MSYHPDTVEPDDVTWLSRLFGEGRGAVELREQPQGGRRYSYPAIRFGSTDLDLIDRIADTLGTRPCRNGTPPAGKAQRWHVIVVGSNAAAWLHRMRPTLTGDRAAKVDQILTEYNARGQRGMALAQ